MAAAGADLYAANCAVCHGAELEGGFGPTLGPDGNSPGYSDAELIEIVTNGRGSMPPFGGQLSRQEITAIVAFIRGFHAGG